jgi:beta-galactosidase
MNVLALSSLLALCLSASPAMSAEPPARERSDFNAGWSFQKGDPAGLDDALAYSKIKPWLLASGNAFTNQPTPMPTEKLPTPEFAKPDFDDRGWRKLNLPHDWGIEGPFRQEYPGETGKLPWWGVAWYRKSFDLPPGATGGQVSLEVDGAMAYPSVWVNGQFAGGWAYGYSSFQVDLTPFVRPGEKNTIAIRLDNPPESSRWYPGGGIYRNVRLVRTGPVRLGHWGTQITTPQVTADSAKVKIVTALENAIREPADVQVRTQLVALPREGEVLTRSVSISSEPSSLKVGPSATVTQEIAVKNPRLWSLETPNCYVAITEVLRDGKVIDEYRTPFGIRSIEFTPDRGFLLNGKRVPLQGVCMHHDLGALGAAFNESAARRQIEILKEMGVNAIRLTHNPSAPEFIDLCDRLGVLTVAESFDCWIWGKTRNDYARLFPDWAERDLRALIRRDRNHPSLIMWSLGNEIVKVEAPENSEIAKRLVAIVHEEDTTRPATSGVNNTPTGYNGFQKLWDVFGFNYRSMEYAKFRGANPTIPVYGSETASTVSSRGEYFFPVTAERSGGMGSMIEKGNFQMSSYDLSAPAWAWPPDAEFKWLDQTPATLGEFVWTGFDYLGEPTPYTSDGTTLMNISDPVLKEKYRKELKEMGAQEPPSRSSYFGIVDLAGFKKDRFYLYQARWRPELPMAHLLPHWTWPGREGQVTPVHLYTSGDEAELFLNGQSLGKKKRGPHDYRLRWDDVKYAPGELKVVVTKGGKEWAGDTVRTAGAPARLEFKPDRSSLVADGKDLAFLTVRILDGKGVAVPRANNLVKFEISGPGDVVAVDNGDATSHQPFQAQQITAYNGMALAIIRTRPGASGKVTVRAFAQGLPSAAVELTVNAK